MRETSCAWWETDDALIDKHLLPLMGTEETKFFTLPVGRGKNRTLQIHSRNTVAWNARKEGLNMAFKIRGLYVRDQENKVRSFDLYHLPHGYWEAKDGQDDLAREVDRKLEKGYPATTSFLWRLWTVSIFSRKDGIAKSG
jgi:hypothetical protein